MKDVPNGKIIVVGAGPAGLTAAYEIGSKNVTIFEKESFVGGISRTAEYKGNRIDIGGHRFFSKSDAVMDWWNKILPFQEDGENADDTELIMLKRSRLSRILWMRKLFDYPLSLSPKTILNLGGKCSEIDASWGAQRIKGVSIKKAIIHALFGRRKKGGIRRKNVETSLIDEFLYPKFGPGQLWERVAELCVRKGVRLEMRADVDEIYVENGRVAGVRVRREDGSLERFDCDALVSSMPIRELFSKLRCADIPKDIADIANGLLYRDFRTVGVWCNKILLNSEKMQNGITKDNWIYIQEPDVKVGRLQIFNNWSPYLVKDKGRIWIGLEYFCQEGDEMWEMSDSEMIETARRELQKCAVANPENVLDAVVIKTKKAYPAYFGTYGKFGEVRNFLDKIENLYCVGRNGQHRYNNMDHSMLSAMEAAKIINCGGSLSKDAVWNVNAEESYHESK